MLLFRSKFNRLVADLRAEDNLDADHLYLVRSFSWKENKSNFLFVLFFGVPPLVAFCFFTYLNLIGYADKGSTPEEYAQEYRLVSIFLLLGIFANIHVLYDSYRDQWLYVSLMTLGKKADGEITFFKEDVNSKPEFCEYSFYDHSGRLHSSKVRLNKKNFEYLNYKLGEIVTIRYDTKNPSKNMIASPGFEFFDLRKRKDEKA